MSAPYYPDLPKIGDIVTWHQQTAAGCGTFDGKVVSIETGGVFASQHDEHGGVRYSLVPFERIIRVRTPDNE